ncbi:hypothetical protein X801_02019 [Opisthorchis viverrini]|uniref:Uncharacterized protein n=1 Tax=Opisthorchis viverrini TaxID=6198 RepID=A0A1S8X6K2_OPIVI|nr:hypothetical protein X801_02019 [Opisthorchis viverrini]
MSCEIRASVEFQRTLCPGGYFSGGSGYVLTREALKRIVDRAIDRHPLCPNTDEDKEDVKMCKFFRQFEGYPRS